MCVTDYNILVLTICHSNSSVQFILLMCAINSMSSQLLTCFSCLHAGHDLTQVMDDLFEVITLSTFKMPVQTLVITVMQVTKATICYYHHASYKSNNLYC